MSLVTNGNIDGYQRVSILIDSDALDSVLSVEDCTDASLQETNKSRVGYAYEVADGYKIANESQIDIVFVSR